MYRSSYDLEDVSKDSISDLKFWLIDNDIIFNHRKDLGVLELFDIDKLHDYKLKILYQKLKSAEARRIVNEDFGGNANVATYGNTPGMGSVEPATSSSNGSGDIFVGQSDEFETYKKFKKKKKRKLKNAK